MNPMVRIPFTGTSMRPAIEPGATLLVEWFSRPGDMRSMQPGSIVLLRGDGELVAHRVLSDYGRRGVKGDGSRVRDAPAGVVVGLVHAIECRMRVRSVYPVTGICRLNAWLSEFGLGGVWRGRLARRLMKVLARIA